MKVGSEKTRSGRELRDNQTDAERVLWSALRSDRLGAFTFHRQKPIGAFVADFICLQKRLVIELDGGQHARQAGYDRRRSSFLRSLGYRVIRFWDREVMMNMDAVLTAILAALSDPVPSLPARRTRRT